MEYYVFENGNPIVGVTPEGNKLNVSLEYRIVGLPIVETIEFVLQRPE